MTKPMNLAEADRISWRINALRHSLPVINPRFVAETEAEILALNTQLVEAGWI